MPQLYLTEDYKLEGWEGKDGQYHVVYYERKNGEIPIESTERKTFESEDKAQEYIEGIIG